MGPWGREVSEAALVYMLGLDWSWASPIYVVHLLGELYLDCAEYFFPDLTFLNVYTDQHSDQPNPT